MTALTGPQASLFVSVVLVLRDDAAHAAGLLREIVDVLHATYENYEVVVVDDGSTDATVQVLQPLLAICAGVRVLRLSRRFGEEIALTAGLESAIGDVVVTMTPFDPPDRLPDLIARAHAAGGIVNGRVERQSTSRSPLRQILSQAYHVLGTRWLGIELVQDATSFRAMTRQALNAVVRIREKHRYLQVFAPYIGLRFEYVTYTPRTIPGRGRHLPLSAAANRALDIVVTSSVRPLRAVTWLGLLASGLNVLYMLYIFGVALVKRHVAEGWITLSLQHAVMFLLMSLILAVIAEYVGRVLSESRDRPLYFVRDELTSTALVPIAQRRNIVTESR